MTSMIRHYHGTPVWGFKGEVHKVAVKGAGAFVSYARPDQIKQSLKHASSIGIDNGAFSNWKRGLEIDWLEFYKWLMNYYFHPKMTFFIIPDKIDGDEFENNQLIKSVPKMFAEKATPVWHLHESLDKLDWLCGDYKRVAFGSSEQYRTVRSKLWKKRMQQAFELMHSKNHKTMIHGLRMLDNRVLGQYPLTTADSTNLACNVPKFRVKHPNLGKHIMNREKDKKRIMGHDGQYYIEESIKKDDKKELLLYRCASLKNAIEKSIPPTLSDYIRNT